jgi:uncharacterized protein YndB with AHSA1/START domain
MTLNLRASILVKAPAERLFELICTPERLPDWNVSVEHARRAAADQAVCLGSRAIFSGKLLGKSLESETEVIHFEPPRLFATQAIRGPRLTTRFELELQPDGTRVVVDVTGDVPGGAVGTRLAEGFLRKELTASLVRLRAIGEAAGTPQT